MAKGWHLQWIPVVAGIAVALVGVQLGNWQGRRAEDKTRLHEHLVAAAAAPAVPLQGTVVEAWQRVRLEGEWLPQGTIFLDNRMQAGRPGFYVLTPLRLGAGGETVLVSRGWVAAGPDRTRLPDLPAVTGAAQIEGVVRFPEGKPFTLSDHPGEGRLWQVLDLPAYRQVFHMPVLAFVVYQTSEGGDGLVRDWPSPDAGIDRHRGYALQWYGLAAAAAAMTGLYVRRTWWRKELKSS